ncbi:MAG TPA: DinB family protein [Bryobacteraceae bacterium]|jgi:uncharacterized damage-inducible protein DinB
MTRLVTAIAFSAVALFAQGQRQPPTPAQAIRNQFAYVNQKVLAMAKDFPEAKYAYKPQADVRSFGEVIVHLASGNAYGAKAGRGENVKWDEMDAKQYKTKADMVAALQKSIDDATATLKDTPDDRFKETLAPWMAIIEHAAEHYGQLVVYYRANGLVPPESRPK